MFERNAREEEEREAAEAGYKTREPQGKKFPGREEILTLSFTTNARRDLRVDFLTRKNRSGAQRVHLGHPPHSVGGGGVGRSWK